MARKKSDKGQHLFSESPYYDDFELFESKFSGTKYEFCDLEFYFESVKNWSDAGGNKKVDWIATARSFMLSDLRNNKLKMKKGIYDRKQNSDNQRIGAELDELINSKYGNGPAGQGQHKNPDASGPALF
jgi:hypothetical protein